MNMQLIQQVKKMQKDIEHDMSKLESTTFNYENSNVIVECNGKHKITKIEIKNDDLLSDKEMLSDVILVGINDVFDQVEKEKDRKLSKYGSGLGGLF